MPCCEMPTATSSYTPVAKYWIDFCRSSSACLQSSFLAISSPFCHHLISVFGPHAQTRASRGCRSRGLGLSCLVRSASTSPASCLDAPLTLRMMDRVVSSMNSTRTWVTPPREPVRPRTPVVHCQRILPLLCPPAAASSDIRRTGDLDELDWLLSGIHGCGFL